jgi:hypothetical protein
MCRGRNASLADHRLARARLSAAMVQSQHRYTLLRLQGRHCSVLPYPVYFFLRADTVAALRAAFIDLTFHLAPDLHDVSFGAFTSRSWSGSPCRYWH